MINKQIKLVLVIGFVGLTILLSPSISTIIIAMLLGALFGPPILLFASVLCNFRIRRIYNLRAAVYIVNNQYT